MYQQVTHIFQSIRSIQTDHVNCAGYRYLSRCRLLGLYELLYIHSTCRRGHSLLDTWRL